MDRTADQNAVVDPHRRQVLVDPDQVLLVPDTADEETTVSPDEIVTLTAANGRLQQFRVRSAPTDRMGSALERFWQKECARTDHLLRDARIALKHHDAAIDALSSTVALSMGDITSAADAVVRSIGDDVLAIGSSLPSAIDLASNGLVSRDWMTDLTATWSTTAASTALLAAEQVNATVDRITEETAAIGAALGHLTLPSIEESFNVYDALVPRIDVANYAAEWILGPKIDAATALLSEDIRTTVTDYRQELANLVLGVGGVATELNMGDAITQMLATMPSPSITSAAVLGEFPGIGIVTDRIRADLAGIAAGWDVAAQVTIGSWYDDPPWLRPGTQDGDLHILQSATADDAEVLAALERTMERLVRYPRNPVARRALTVRAREEETREETILRRETRAAILLVLSLQDHPQRHRFGREWVLDVDGKVAVVPINDLPAMWFWDWLRREVLKAVTASLLERPYPPVSEDVWDRATPDGQPLRSALADDAPIADREQDPLELLLVVERQHEATAQLNLILSQATDRQRQLVMLLGSGLSEAEAARRLGLAPATARVHLRNLRRKLA